MGNKPSSQRKKKSTNQELDVTSVLSKSNEKNQTFIGISLSHLRCLLDVLGISKTKQHELDFYAVTENIKQITKNLAHPDRSYVSYVKIQDSEPESKIGFAEYFVSYAWAGKFLQTIQALVVVRDNTGDSTSTKKTKRTILIYITV